MGRLDFTPSADLQIQRGGRGGGVDVFQRGRVYDRADPWFWMVDFSLARLRQKINRSKERQLVITCRRNLFWLVLSTTLVFSSIAVGQSATGKRRSA